MIIITPADKTARAKAVTPVYINIVFKSAPVGGVIIIVAFAGASLTFTTCFVVETSAFFMASVL